MKNIILQFMIFFLSGSALSQNQNLFITGLNITQINDSQIKANLKVYSPDLATYNTYTTEITGNIITLKVCYNAYFIPDISYLDNNFDITIPTNSGNYIFKVEVYRANPGVCNFDPLFLEDSAELNFTNPFTGTITLGITEAEVKGKNLKIFPNPVSDILHFSAEISNVKITDVSGKIVKEFAKSATSISVSKLTRGIYFFTATSKLGEPISRKIVKE